MAATNPDSKAPLVKVENGQGVAEFAWSASVASDHARMHNGNVYITNSHTHIADQNDQRVDGTNLHAELLQAASKGRVRRVEYLLGLKASLDYKDENGMTALHHSALSGYEEVVRLLLHRGADVDAHSKLYGSALCLAILKDRINVTRALLEGRPFVGRPTEGIGTELHCVSWTGHCEIAAMLLQNSAAVNNKAHVSELRMELLNDGGTVVLSEHLRQRIEASPRISCFPLSLAVLRGHFELTKLLLDNGALVDEDCVWSNPSQPTSPSSPPYRATSAIIAATYGYHDILKLLIDHGANLGIRNGEGRSALAIAADKGHEKCVVALLNATKVHSSTDCETAFHLAVNGGHTECVRAFCSSNTNVDSVNDDGHTTLRIAAQRGDLATALVLLNAGANVDGKSSVGSSPLTIAAEQGHVQIVELLLSRGASVATPKHDTGTLFSAALGHLDSKNGHAMLEALLRPKLGDPVSENDLKEVLAVLKKGRSSSREEVTAAMVVAAASAGNEGSLKALHRVGADLNSRFSDGQTALHRVARDRHFTGTLRLLNLGAKVNVFDQRGYIPLMNAIQEGQVQMVEEMIRRGANVNAQAKSGLTPIHLAVRCNATEALTALLRSEADTSVQDLVEGNTPLHQAAISDNRAAARLLLQYKASLRTKNKDGHTPEDLARKWSHQDVCDVLEEFREPREGEQGVAGEQQGNDGALEPENSTVEAQHVMVLEAESQEEDDGSVTLAETVGDDTPNQVPDATPDITESPEHRTPYDANLQENEGRKTEREPELVHHVDAELPSHEASKVGDVVEADHTHSAEPASFDMAKIDEELSEILAKARKSDESGKAGAHEALAKAGFAKTGFHIGSSNSYFTNPSKGWEWAMWLCEEDYDDFKLRAIVKLLLEHGALVDGYFDGWTFLQVAARRGKVAVADLLIAHGADINFLNWVGYSPVQEAVFHLQYSKTAHLHILQLLLKHKPSLDVVNDSERPTPLLLAVGGNLPEVVQVLIAGGASVNYGEGFCNRDGELLTWPLVRALQDDEFEIMRILLGHGARVSKSTGGLIVAAAWYGAGMSLKVILERAKQNPDFLKDLDPNALSPADRPRPGQTPLHLIATAPAPKIEACLALLIEAGANVNAVDLDGNTPLHHAAKAGSAYMVGVLKKGGVDLRRCNNSGKTAIDLANGKGHKEIVELLGGTFKKKWYKV